MIRRHLRTGVMSAVLSLVLAVGLGADLASADPADDHETDLEHAEQDLVGTPITEIERQTRANAAKIREATGVAPGGHSSSQKIANASLSTAAAADPGVGGAWSSVMPTDVVPIFQAVLPNGKVLMWDSVGDGPVDSYSDHSFTRALVWDPNTNTSVRRDVQGYNIFCAGYTQLADGRLLVAGGNKDSASNGIVQTHIFDWRTETWSRGPDMASARWYPSVAALGNDEAVIVGGGPSIPEVYETNGALRRLTNASGYSARIYPFLVPRPDGQVELVGPYNPMNTINTTGTGLITATKSRDGIARDYGSFATYGIGKVLVAGGGNITEDNQSSVPTKTAVIVDVNNGSRVASTASMSVGRRQHNLTVLADGSVLATGGQSSSVDGLVDLVHPVFAAERWDPATGTWTVLSSASRVREYHSTATLLPDARVLTGGGGICNSCQSNGYLEKNVEYFEPPYLFKKDGSGLRADRPVIDSAPSTAGYGQSLAITSAQAGSIAKVGLVRLGAPTHSEDQGQRYVPLSFDKSGTTITATSPTTSNIAPAGYYMLFITDSAGVPSVAKMIKLERGSINPPPPATTSRTFSAAADARVVEANPASNFGTATTLIADGGADPDVESYLKFDVSGVSGSVTNVKLRLHTNSGASSASANGPAVYGTGTGWTETGITWSNRPARSTAALEDKGAVTANTWLDYDVTGAGIAGDGSYGFVVATSSSDGTVFDSREAASFRPELIVTSSGGTADTTAPDTTITSGPTGIVSSTSATFEFSSTEAGSSFACSLDGAAYQSCTSPKSYSGLAATTHTLSVRATDPAGNTDATPATQTWTISPPATVSRTFSAAADARVVEASPASNYGGADPDVESNLKFDLSGVSGSVTNVKLRLHTTSNPSSASADGPAVYGTGTGWTETGITWSNRPARTTAKLADKGAITSNTWLEYDVTGAGITGNGTYGFVVATISTDGTELDSREAASFQPELIVTTGSG